MDWRAYWKEFVAALVAVVMLWIAFVGGNRIPLLGSFDLGIHELGHLITSPFGEVASFFMGSGLQVLVPFGLAGYFWFWQHDRLSSGLRILDGKGQFAYRLQYAKCPGQETEDCIRRT